MIRSSIAIVSLCLALTMSARSSEKEWKIRSLQDRGRASQLVKMRRGRWSTSMTLTSSQVVRGVLRLRATPQSLVKAKNWKKEVMTAYLRTTTICRRLSHFRVRQYQVEAFLVKSKPLLRAPAAVQLCRLALTRVRRLSSCRRYALS